MSTPLSPLTPILLSILLSSLSLLSSSLLDFNFKSPLSIGDLSLLSRGDLSLRSRGDLSLSSFLLSSSLRLSESLKVCLKSSLRSSFLNQRCKRCFGAINLRLSKGGDDHEATPMVNYPINFSRGTKDDFVPNPCVVGYWSPIPVWMWVNL